MQPEVPDQVTPPILSKTIVYLTIAGTVATVIVSALSSTVLEPYLEQYDWLKTVLVLAGAVVTASGAIVGVLQGSREARRFVTPIDNPGLMIRGVRVPLVPKSEEERIARGTQRRHPSGRRIMEP
jgi:hypothetical protein